jgi:hypothetical protein
MSYTSKTMVIADMVLANEGKRLPQWQPFKKVAELMVAQNTVEYMNSKRMRYTSTDKSNLPGTNNVISNCNASGARTAWNSKNTTIMSNKTGVEVNDSLTKPMTWDEIQVKIQENVDASANMFRVEFKNSNKATNERISEIDKKLDQYSITVDAKLDNITEQCTTNTTNTTNIGNCVNRLEAMFSKLFGSDKENANSTSRLSAHSIVETPVKMDYQKSRDELELKRQLNFSPNVSITLTPSQGDNCSGIAAPPKKK